MSRIPAADPESRNRIFLRLGPNGALGADDRQWVPYRLVQTDRPRHGSTWQGVEWNAVSYVRSTKRILASRIREKGIDLSPEGQVALDALADDFDSWRADPGRRGTPVAPEALKPLETRLIGYTTPSEGEGRASFVLVERLGPDCAIGTDGRQWIVLRANGRVKSRYPSDGWNCVGFIHSDKRALISCIKAKGLKLSAAGRAALDRQDEKIHRWRLAGSTGKLELAA